jgi:hypothetical protein
LIAFFDGLGLLRRVNGDQEIEAVTEELLKAIPEKKA